MRDEVDGGGAGRRDAWRSSPPVWAALPVLLLSLLAGAATERDETVSAPSAQPLRGSAAGAFGNPELRAVDGTRDQVQLVGDEEVGTVAVLLPPSASETALGEGQRLTPDLLLDEAEDGAGRALCGRAVALASSTGRPLPRLEEAEALRSACLELLGVEVPSCPPDAEGCSLVGPRGDPDRVAELVVAARAGGSARAVEPPVTRLEASVVAGTGTRSSIAVTLVRDDGYGSGPPAQDEAVVAAYPGGEVVGLTDRDGRAVLPLPDVAVRDPLPVRVSWRGVLPVGTVLRSLPTPEQETSLEGYPSFSAWLLAPVPYDLGVLVRRDAAPR